MPAAVVSSCRHWKRNCGKAPVSAGNDGKGLADTGKGTVAKLHPRRSRLLPGLADTGKGTVAKPTKAHASMTARLADTGKGTVAKLHPSARRASARLADTGKGTVAKLCSLNGVWEERLADTGKGTVAKRGRSPRLLYEVLPTLEKELWQSHRDERTRD